MDPRVEALFTETVVMEGKVAALYRLFAKLFADDATFWADLAAQEQYHAEIFQNGKDYFFEDNLFPLEALDPDLQDIRNTNADLDMYLALYEQTPPLRSSAFMCALMFEGSSGEYYFQLALDLPPRTRALQVLRILTGGEKNHAKKIFDRFMGSAHPLKPE